MTFGKTQTARFPRLAVAVGMALVGALAGRASALETDQFTIPPAPLVDVGPTVQQKVRAMLQGVAARANASQLDHREAAKSATFGFSRKSHEEEADRAATADYVASAFDRATGPGFVECDLEIWLRTSVFPGGTHLFDPPIGDSIYGSDPLGKPITLLTLSPTVNLFGIDLGTDKIGHFFGQGYEYYRAFRQAEDAGEDPAACVRRAIEVGVFEEKNYYGLLTVGVYSNADLAANFSGFKFFLNLTRPVLIDGRRREPMLVQRQGLWELNPELPTEFLRPFFSPHFDESLNPSFYNDQLRATVRARFPERAARWAEFHHLNRAGEPERLRSMANFSGEPYGHSTFDGVAVMIDLMPPDKAVVPEPLPGRSVVPAERHAATAHVGAGH